MKEELPQNSRQEIPQNSRQEIPKEEIGIVKKFIEENKDVISKKDYSQLLLILKKIEIKKALITGEDKIEAENLKSKGNDLFKEGKLEESLELYNKALEKDPRNYFIYSNRALVYQKIAMKEKAIEDCLIGIEIEPSFVKFYIRLATLVEDKSEKMKYIEEGLKYEPENKMLLDMKEDDSESNNTENPFDLKTFDSLMKNKELQDMVGSFVKDKSPEELNQMMSSVLGKFGGKNKFN